MSLAVRVYTTPMVTKPYFTVVIPTLNEEKYLPLLLKDLVAQTNHDFEVIHCDGGSTDKTLAKAQKFATKLPLTSINCERKNVSHQRNMGKNAAKGEWIVFLDADTRIPPYFLDGFKYQIAKNLGAVDIFTAWTKAEGDDTFAQAFEYIYNYGYEVIAKLGMESAPGACIGASRKVCKQIDFDEKHRVYEDVFFVQTAVAAGFQFMIFHEPRFSFSMRRFRKEGMLKATKAITLTLFSFLQGDDFSRDDYGYVMKGGGYYDEANASVFEPLINAIQKATTKQKEQMITLFKAFRESNDK